MNPIRVFVSLFLPAFFVLNLSLSTPSFAGHYPYKFSPGEKILVTESRWAELRPDGSHCQLQPPGELTVIEQKDHDVLLEYKGVRLARHTECPQGHRFMYVDHYADTLRDESLARVKVLNEVAVILSGKSSVGSYKGFFVGDTFGIRGWTWANLVEETRNTNRRFFATDLCRIREPGAARILGFITFTDQVLMEYDVEWNADFSDCPKGARYLVGVKELLSR